MQYFTQLFALATAVSSIVVPAVAQQFEDTFDDLATNVAAPLTSPVGNYHGLAYKGVVVIVRLLIPPSYNRLKAQG